MSGVIRTIRRFVVLGVVGYFATQYLEFPSEDHIDPNDKEDEDEGSKDAHHQMSKEDAQASILGYVAASVGALAQLEHYTGAVSKSASKAAEAAKVVKSRLTDPKRLIGAEAKIEEIARGVKEAPVAIRGLEGSLHEVVPKAAPKVTDAKGALIETEQLLGSKVKVKAVEKPHWPSVDPVPLISEQVETLSQGVKAVRAVPEAVGEATNVVIEGSHASGIAAETASKAGTAGVRAVMEGLGEGAGKAAEVISKGGGKIMGAADGAFIVQMGAGLPTAVAQTALGCYKDDGAGGTKSGIGQFGAATGLDLQGTNYSDAADNCQTATGKQVQKGLETATETIENGTACFFSGRAFNNPGTCDAEHMTGGEKIAAGVIGWIPAAPTMAAGSVVALGDTVASQIHNAGVHPIEAAETAVNATKATTQQAAATLAAVATNSARTVSAQAASTYSAANATVQQAEATTVAVASNAAHAAAQGAQVTAHAVATTTTHAVQATGNVVNTVENTVQHAASTAVRETSHAVTNTVHQATNTVQHTASAVAHTASNVGNSLRHGFGLW